MTLRRGLSLRARFLLVGAVFVLTAMGSSAWTLLALSRLAAVTRAMAAESEETTQATASLTTAIEREDDALLVALDFDPSNIAALGRARATTDAERAALRAVLESESEDRAEVEIDEAIDAYRAASDAVVHGHSRRPLEDYHQRVNAPLRTVVASVGRVRDKRFAQTRDAVELARTEVGKTRAAVAAIALVSLLVSMAVAFRMARSVALPLRDLADGARRIREGTFRVRVDVPAGDELALVADAFNDMAQRIEASRTEDLAEIRRAKGTLEAMMSALPDAVFLLDDAERVLAANPAAVALCKDVGVGTPVSREGLVELGVPPRRLARAVAGEELAEPVGLSDAIDVSLGVETRRLSIRFARAASPSGPGPAVVVVLSDVTELARLDERRAELVAIASHELRTPVTSLRMSLQMLAEERHTMAARSSELVAVALAGIDQLGETVDELLDVTRIEAGRLRLQTERLDAMELVRAAVGRARPRADELGVALAVAGPPALMVVGDRARLKVVFDNLIDNAVKYSPSDETVELAVNVDEAGVLITVSDRGPGVPAAFRERVFEKFFRVEQHRPGTEGAPRGTGIGLYLCREIVELHGGAIHCLPTSGESGTIMVLRLPSPAGEAEPKEP